ncbi:hypothetical protein [Nocardia sp. NBC_01388]|uniref:hypothetical protein n=1 Tax=Nocardia sp. NBC_01388 TaxID=2903596 RepID=UPI0032534D69
MKQSDSMVNVDNEVDTPEGGVAEQQLNVKIPRTTATSAKRLARRHGMQLNVWITKLINDAVAAEAEEMAAQFDDEQQKAMAEYAEMQAYLKEMSEVAKAKAAKAEQSDTANT